jgi:hypothetical protein
MKPLTAKYNKRESELVRTSVRIIDEMTDNPDFPDPPAELAELKKEALEFQVAHANALSGDKKKVSIKNDKKAILLAILQVLADYVTVKSKGDRTLILSGGFDVAGENNAYKNLPPSIEKLEVELGQAGVVTIIARNVTNAKGYAHQYTKEQPDVHTEWMGTASSHASHTFEGLTSGQQYWFRVIAIGLKRQRAYSPIVSRFIQ